MQPPGSLSQMYHGKQNVRVTTIAVLTTTISSEASGEYSVESS